MALSDLCRCVCSSLPTSRPVSLGTKPLSYWEAVRRYVRLQALQGTFLACRLGSLDPSIVSFHSVAPELIGGICRHGKANLASKSSPPASLLHQNCVSKRIGDARLRASPARRKNLYVTMCDALSCTEARRRPQASNPPKNICSCQVNGA